MPHLYSIRIVHSHCTSEWWINASSKFSRSANAIAPSKKLSNRVSLKHHDAPSIPIRPARRYLRGTTPLRSRAGSEPVPVPGRSRAAAAAPPPGACPSSVALDAAAERPSPSTVSGRAPPRGRRAETAAGGGAARSPGRRRRGVGEGSGIPGTVRAGLRRED